MSRQRRRRPSSGPWDDAVVHWLADSGVLLTLIVAVVVPIAVGIAAAAVLHLSRMLALELALLAALMVLVLGLAAARERARRARAVRTARSLDAIRDMSWQDFERLVAGVYSKDGWSVMPTSAGADGGIDLIMTKGGSRCFVQCKRWKTRVVKVDAIRSLYGVMAMEGVRQGVFVTAGRFTSEATRFAADCGIRCVDGEQLLAMLGASSVPLPHLTDAPSGEQSPAPPSCPRCREAMVRRVSARGPFWGCPRFPSCRGTRPL